MFWYRSSLIALLSALFSIAACFGGEKQRADVNAADPDGTTPLAWAAYNDDLPTAQRLLREGANAKTANRYGVTPLSLAAQKGYEAIVKLLLDTGKVDADLKGKDGRTPLWLAAQNGHEAIVKLLLDTGKVDADAKDIDGRTPLSLAAEKGHEAIVKLLLNTGKVDADAEDIAGRTPLWLAALKGHEAVVKLLQSCNGFESPLPSHHLATVSSLYISK